jgi:hypothetical protein
LINLNIVHQYYQIPLVYSLGLIIIFFYESLKELVVFRENQKVIVLILFLVSLYSVSNAGTDSKSYLNMVMLNENNENLCPLDASIEGPVLVPKIENPGYLYRCGLTSFQSDFSNSTDVESFLKERFRYHYMYSSSNASDPSLNDLKSKLKIKKIEPLGENWFKIYFT